MPVPSSPRKAPRYPLTLVNRTSAGLLIRILISIEASTTIQGAGWLNRLATTLNVLPLYLA